MEYLDKIKSILPEVREQILSIYNSDFEVYYKEDKSPVTEADILVEKILVKFLSENFDFPIIGEESFNSSVSLDVDSYWAIDPIDGTRQFANKSGNFACSIGLIINNEPYFGLVYNPVANDLFYAEKNKGAFHEKMGVINKISVRKFPVDEVLVAFNSSATDKEEYIELLSSKFGRARKLILHSAALKLCELARGLYDVFPFKKLNEWDVAAGHIILKEAGGNLYSHNGLEVKYCANKNCLRNITATREEIIKHLLD